MIPIPILLYHSVGTTAAEAYRRWCVEPSLFADHLDALSAEGYRDLTVSELLDAVDRDELPSKPVVLTFDDGRADFVEHAAPELDRRGMAATMYVVSGHVGGTSRWLRIAGEAEQPMMSWADLRSIAAAGHEVGAHSQTHPELDVLRRAAAAAEIAGSRRTLEDGIGGEVRSFAYPHGYHSSATVDAVRAAGFDSACAVNDRWSWLGEPRLALSRLIVEGGTSPGALLERLADQPATPHPPRRALRAGWRCVRWARHRAPFGLAR